MSKKTPNSIKAEQGVIGSVLMKPDIYHNLEVEADWFYQSRHRLLWKYIADISNDRPVWDVLLLTEKIKKEGDLQKVGGYDYLSELQDYNLVPAYSQHYANEVEEAYKLRNEIEVLEKALAKAYDGESCTDSVIADLLKAPVDIEYNNEDILNEWKLSQDGTRVTIPTPYPSIDRQAGGIRQGMVTLFTGRSKSGKSMFLAHWYNYLGQLDIPVLVIPLEDRRHITVKRMAANLGKHDNSVLDAGGYYVRCDGQWVWYKTSDEQIQKAFQAIKKVSDYPIHFYDRKCTPRQLMGIAIRYKRKYNIKAMFVDGAKDLLRPSGKYGDVGFDEEISQELCRIASKLDIAVIAVHHLTKLQDGEKINVNHIRGSGNIVSDSRAVYALQSECDGLVIENNYAVSYDDEGKSRMRVFECLSNNHGGVASKFLEADLARCQFKECTVNLDK
tara:strand:+ start:424 stop:1755 length:1332 start_codon:yes stop_codon:yes gene_type:complete